MFSAFQGLLGVLGIKIVGCKNNFANKKNTTTKLSGNTNNKVILPPVNKKSKYK